MRINVAAVVISFFLFPIIFCGTARAANFEIHPGVRASYEYTDNYFGTAQDEESENIYEIGPTLDFSWATPSLTWENSGYIARRYHEEFDEDDSTEVSVESHMAASSIRHALDLTYSYIQTRERESLEDPLGIARVNSGTVGYTNTVSPETALSLGYSVTDENNPAPDEDIMSQGPTLSLTHQLTARQRLSLSYGYVYHDYDISENTWVSTSNAHWGYMVTPVVELGTGCTYEHEDRGRLPSEDIYSATLTAGYSIARHTTIDVAGGYSWLVLEHEDRQGTYTLDAEISHETRYDVFSLSASKGYTAEFTTDRYGTYDTWSVLASWDRTLMRTLVFSASASFDDSDPTSDTLEERERDKVGTVALAWTPSTHFEARASYERLRHEYEISDTEKENRYRIIIEGRY